MQIRLSLLLVLTAAFALASPPPQAASLEAPREKGEQARAGTRPAQRGSGLLELLPESVRTQHAITISGRVLAYESTAGTLDLLGSDGKMSARIFYVAHQLTSRSAAEQAGAGRRPVTFVFNGGPGAASAYLQIGAVGPRIVRTSPDGEFLPPPQVVEDNPDTWLPMTDLVFVDPVGTGYSRAGEGTKPQQFWGIERDAAAMGGFIRRYLEAAGRTGSPIYLLGESYGGFRAAVLARTLQQDVGFAPSGLVLISPALDFSFIHGDEGNPLSWALSLPAMAAVHLERQGVHGEALRRDLAQVEQYALTDYLVALASGLKPGGEAASARVAELTGLPLDLVRRHFARIPVRVFAREFERASGQVVSAYDASVAAPNIAPASGRPATPDPLLDRSVAAMTSAFVRHVRDELGYRTTLDYRLLNGEVARSWDYGTRPTRQGYASALDDLQQARALNPRLRVLIAHGLSDLVTPYPVSAYLVRQLPTLAGAEPIRIRTYEGGHMMYLRPQSRRALRLDAAELYDGGS